MALRLLVKPGEKLHLGTSNIIIAAEQVVAVIIEGDIPIVRNSDYMEASSANTTARKVYMALQDIYLNDNIEAGRVVYFDNIKILLEEFPPASEFVTQINGFLASRELYKALKVGRGIVQLNERALSWPSVINAD